MGSAAKEESLYIKIYNEAGRNGWRAIYPLWTRLLVKHLFIGHPFFYAGSDLLQRGEVLLRRLVNGHGFDHIDQVQAADNPLLAANGDGNGSDFLLLLPAAKVFAVAVLPGAFEDGGTVFPARAPADTPLPVGRYSISTIGLRSCSGAKASQVNPEAVSSSGRRRYRPSPGGRRGG